MKKMIATIALLLLPLSSFAVTELRPGSSVVVNGEIIVCQAPDSSHVPACSIRQDGTYYRVYTGATIANSYFTFDQAVSAVKELKAAGLCK